MEVNFPPPPGNELVNIHASESYWTDERIEHAYANSISQIPDIQVGRFLIRTVDQDRTESARNTMGVRGKRIQLLGLF